MLMAKSNFQPPKLKDKACWSPDFHQFLKLSLTKNPRKRPVAEKLLQHPFVCQPLARVLVIELLDKATNPELTASALDDGDFEAYDVFPDKICSSKPRGPAEGTLSEIQLNQVKFGPPLRKETEPWSNPTEEEEENWMVLGDGESLLQSVEEALEERSLTIRPAHPTDQTQEEQQTDGLGEDFSSTIKRGPFWDFLNLELSCKAPWEQDGERADLEGPRGHTVPEVAVPWIASYTQSSYLYLVVGAEEGIYTLNLHELHEDTMEKLLPHRCSWLYCINNTLLTLAGKKFALSAKIADTKGCLKCQIVRNPYSGNTFLCAALPSSLALLQWYEPLQKFMLLKHVPVLLPYPLSLFELLVVETEEYPQVCFGVTGSDQPGAELHFSVLSLSTGHTSSSPSSKKGYLVGWKERKGKER
ncbi:hypothetical protein Chor_014839 [Crotalus horridus]